jgi:hypothetical protein
MANIKFNHFNSSAFNSFVPEAAKVANNQFLKRVLIVGGIAFVLWYFLRPKPVVVSKEVEDKE